MVPEGDGNAWFSPAHYLRINIEEEMVPEGDGNGF